MIILGTPSVTFDLGMPDWLLILIIIAAYVLFRVGKTIYIRYQEKKNADEFEAQEGIESSDGDISSGDSSTM